MTRTGAAGSPSAAFPGGRVGERRRQKLAPGARSALVDLRRHGRLNDWYIVWSLTSHQHSYISDIFKVGNENRQLQGADVWSYSIRV